MQPHPLSNGEKITFKMSPLPRGWGCMHLTAFLMSFFALEINLQARASCTQNLIMYWCEGVEADGTNLKVNKTGNSIKWKIQQVATPESKLITRHLWSCCSHKSGNHGSTV